MVRSLSALGLPVFVKPARLGSSVGIGRVLEQAELAPALAAAFVHDPLVIVEASASGIEVECSVLGNDTPIASLPGEILLAAGESGWYDYEAKYTSGGMELIVPARISESALERVRALAVAAFTRARCTGLARADFFVDGETVLVNELNTMPGFTETSVYGALFAASGIPYGGAARPARGARARAPRARARLHVLSGVARLRRSGLRASTARRPRRRHRNSAPAVRVKRSGTRIETRSFSDARNRFAAGARPAAETRRAWAVRNGARRHGSHGGATRRSLGGRHADRVRRCHRPGDRQRRRRLRRAARPRRQPGGRDAGRGRAPSTSGTFSFTGVSAGSYKVYFVDPTGTDNVAPAYLGGATSFQSASSVSVAGSGGIGSATLASGGEITGTIADANIGDTNTTVTADQVGATDPGQSAFWNWYASGSPAGHDHNDRFDAELHDRRPRPRLRIHAPVRVRFRHDAALAHAGLRGRERHGQPRPR